MAKEPGDTTVKTLFAYSDNLCQFFEHPVGCEEKLTDPSWGTVNAEIAHIKGNRPGAARYDAAQPDEERHGFDNLLLMCPKHHKMIDRLRPHDFTVELLQDMKRRAMAAAGRSGWSPDESTLALMAAAALDTYRALASTTIGIEAMPEATAIPGGQENNAVRSSATDAVSASIGEPTYPSSDPADDDTNADAAMGRRASNDPDYSRAEEVPHTGATGVGIRRRASNDPLPSKGGRTPDRVTLGVQDTEPRQASETIDLRDMMRQPVAGEIVSRPGGWDSGRRWDEGTWDDDATGNPEDHEWDPPRAPERTRLGEGTLDFNTLA